MERTNDISGQIVQHQKSGDGFHAIVLKGIH